MLYELNGVWIVIEYDYLLEVMKFLVWVSWIME